MKYLLLIIFLNIASLAVSQNSSIKMKNYEDTLITLKKIQLSAYPQSYVDILPDSINDIIHDTSFGELFFKVISMEESWEYQFDSLKQIFPFEIYSSVDKSIRVLSWRSSGYYATYGSSYAQYWSKDNKMILQELIMNNIGDSNRCDVQTSAFTNELYDITINDTNCYLLLRYYIDSDMGKFSSAQIWTIKNDSLIRKPCFRTSEKYGYVRCVLGDLVVRVRKQHIINMNYNPKTNILTHKKYSKIVLEGGDIYYKPTGLIESYIMKDGSFIKIEK